MDDVFDPDGHPDQLGIHCGLRLRLFGSTVGRRRFSLIGTNTANAASVFHVSGSALATPSTPSISNLPSSGTYGGGFTATVATTGDGTKSVTSNSTGICTASGLAVSYVGVGTCSLTAHVAAGTDYSAADGSPQTFSVGQAAPSTPTISNLPASGTYGGGFTATVATTGDGTKSVTSNSTGVCTASGLAVSYVGVGTCTLTAHVAAGTDYSAADGSPQTLCRPGHPEHAVDLESPLQRHLRRWLYRHGRHHRGRHQVGHFELDEHLHGQRPRRLLRRRRHLLAHRPRRGGDGLLGG